MPDRVPVRGSGPPPVPAAGSYETTTSRMADKRFYASTHWRKMRLFVLAETPMCEADGCHSPAEHVHHKTPRKAAPALAFDRANLQALCESCHNKMRGVVAAGEEPSNGALPE